MSFIKSGARCGSTAGWYNPIRSSVRFISSEIINSSSQILSNQVWAQWDIHSRCDPAAKGHNCCSFCLIVIWPWRESKEKALLNINPGRMFVLVLERKEECQMSDLYLVGFAYHCVCTYLHLSTCQLNRVFEARVSSLYLYPLYAGILSRSMVTWDTFLTAVRVSKAHIRFPNRLTF